MGDGMIPLITDDKIVTRALKQKPGSHNCVAVVAAMATGCLPEDFERRIKNHGPPYCDMELFVFLWELGYGLVFGYSEIQSLNPRHQTLKCEIDLEDFQAYLAVKSDINPELTHAILWNGEQIFDPSPLSENGRSIDSYEVLKLYPFSKTPIGEPVV